MIIFWGEIYYSYNLKSYLNYDELNQSIFTLIGNIGFQKSHTWEEFSSVLETIIWYGYAPPI